MPSTSISIRPLQKLALLIIPLAAFHEISLMPRITTIQYNTVCTALGGLAKDLQMKGCNDHKK